MKNDQIEKLTDEIRKLREDVRELRQASQWPRVQYVPVPNYVPQYVPYFPHPSYPWWGNGTVIYGNNPPTYTVTYGNVLANASTTTYYPTNGQPQTEAPQVQTCGMSQL